MENHTGLLKLIMQLVRSEVAMLGLAGVAGAIVSSITKWAGWLHLLRTVIVGGLCAIYLSPIAIPFLEWLFVTIKINDENAPKLGGFVMGMLGIVFVEFVFHVVAVRKEAYKVKQVFDDAYQHDPSARNYPRRRPPEYEWDENDEG